MGLGEHIQEERVGRVKRSKDHILGYYHILRQIKENPAKETGKKWPLSTRRLVIHEAN